MCSYRGLLKLPAPVAAMQDIIQRDATGLIIRKYGGLAVVVGRSNLPD